MQVDLTRFDPHDFPVTKIMKMKRDERNAVRAFFRDWTTAVCAPQPAHRHGRRHDGRS
jgi:hypothetical protein